MPQTFASPRKRRHSVRHRSLIEPLEKPMRSSQRVESFVCASLMPVPPTVSLPPRTSTIASGLAVPMPTLPPVSCNMTWPALAAERMYQSPFTLQWI